MCFTLAQFWLTFLSAILTAYWLAGRRSAVLIVVVESVYYFDQIHSEKCCL